MQRWLVLACLVAFVGCGVEKVEVPPITDADRIKAEDEKNAQMMKSTGEGRLVK